MDRLRMFGGLALEKDGGGPRAMPRKPLALIALLAVAGENGMGREKVAAYLWPESDSDHSRNALNQTLHQVRRSALGDAITGTAELSFVASRLTSDVAEFRCAVAHDDLPGAAALYTGPFLDGFFIRDASAFERWVEEQRQCFSDQYATILARLAHNAKRDNDSAAAVIWWRKLVAHAPLSSRTTLGLMQALADLGDRGAALQLARSHEVLVRQELDAAPAIEIRALADALRAGPEMHASGRPPTPSSPTRSAHDTGPLPAIRVPVAEARPHASAPRRTSWRSASAPVLGLLAATLVLIGAAVLQRWRAPNGPDAEYASFPAGAVLTVPFENLTGDSTLDIIGPLAADWITQGLARTGVVAVAHHSVELWDARTLARLRSSDGARAWSEIGRAAGVRIVIHGSYVRSGDSIRVQAVIADAQSGRVIQAIDPVAAPAIDRMSLADQLRQRVMSVMAARVNPELAHWVNVAGQPARFAAYLEYAEGMTAFADAKWQAATIHFLRSAAEDSSYTLPLLWAVFALHNNGDVARSDSVVNSLNARRATMAPLDRALHDYELAVADPRAEYRAAKRLVELAPGSEFQWKLATAAWGIGRLREALRLIKELDPDKGWVTGMDYWGDLADLEMTLGDYDAAREANRRVRAWAMAELSRGARIAAALGDPAEVRRLLLRMAAHPEVMSSTGLVDGAAAWSAARALRAHGDSASARQIDEWAIGFLDTATLVRQAMKDADAVPFMIFHRAGILYDLGRLAEAQTLFQRMDSMTTTSGVVDRHVAARKSRRNVYALGYLADIALRRGDSAVVRRHRERIVNSPNVEGGADKYMLGRLAALQGLNEEALSLFAALRQSQVEWVNDYRIDPDLATLRAYPPFARLLVFEQ